MNYLLSFLIGGAICIPAQILLDKTKLTNARILTGYVVCGVLLCAIGLYEPIVNVGAAGATVPLTGFGYTLANGVKSAVDKDGLLGIITGGLSATAAGITVAISLGFISSLFFKSKQK